MKQASKLRVAREIIENKIAECMIQLRNSSDEELQKKYKILINIREEIYKGNIKEIDKVIKEEGSKND